MELGDQFATLQIKYEDLLLNTQETIELISKTWHVGRLGERFVNLEQSTKLDAKTFSDYQRYYLKEEWRQNLSATAIETINAALDQNVLQHFGYP